MATIHRSVLQAAVAATDSDRYPIVQVSPDGSVVSTNGHICIKVTERHPVPDAEMPVVGAEGFTGDLTGPVTVPTQVVERLIAGTAKRSTIPALACVRFGQTATGPAGFATDLTLSAFVPITTDHQFPAVDRVLAPQEGPTVTMILSATMLARLAKIAKTVKGTARETYVRFAVPTDGGPVAKAIAITIQTTEHEITGKIMPCQLCRL